MANFEEKINSLDACVACGVPFNVLQEVTFDLLWLTNISYYNTTIDYIG